MRDRADRRAAVRRQLERVGVAFSFVDAVDGRALGATPAYDRERRLRLDGKELRAGELGCYLSHLAVLQKIVDLRLPYAVVLEDDVVAADHLPEVIAALPAVSAGVDFVRLGTSSKRMRPFRAIRKLGTRSALVRFSNVMNGTQGYFVTAAGARKFLAYSRSFAHPVDVAMNRVWENGLTVLGVQPWPLQHDWDSPTSIEESRYDRVRKSFSVRRLERCLRKAYESVAKRLHFLFARGADARLAAEPEAQVPTLDRAA